MNIQGFGNFPQVASANKAGSLRATSQHENASLLSSRVQDSFLKSALQPQVQFAGKKSKEDEEDDAEAVKLAIQGIHYSRAKNEFLDNWKGGTDRQKRDAWEAKKKSYNQRVRKSSDVTGLYSGTDSDPEDY